MIKDDGQRAARGERRSRRALIAVVAIAAGVVLGGAACGAGTRNAGTSAIGNRGSDNGDPSPAPEGATALAPGSSGFAGVDWGDTIDAVQAKYPAATRGEDELALHAAHGGRDATISFMFTGGGQLISISVSFTGSFPSMSACAEPFAQVRTALDGSLGQSGTDNLAAYWSSETASMTLACNPDDPEQGEQASLTMSYSLPEDE